MAYDTGAALLSILSLSPKSAVATNATNLLTKLSTNELDPPDKTANSSYCIPVPLVMLARGCQGDGGSGGAGTINLSATEGTHRDYGVF
jgi:hypothetical protein